MTNKDIKTLAKIFNRNEYLKLAQISNKTHYEGASIIYHHLLAGILIELKRNNSKFDADEFINLLDKSPWKN